MTAPYLIETLDDPTEWPAAQVVDHAYVEAFGRQGSQTLIANLRTRIMAIASQGRVFPLTINDGEVGDAYVCLPHSAYVLYAKAELGLVDVGQWRPFLALIADAAGLAMRLVRLNTIVHLNNWMVSTNLHDGWSGEDLPAIRKLLVERFPDHVLAIRSLTPWADSDLIAQARTDGWILLPARQIFVTDNLTHDWRPRRDTQRDLRLLHRTGAKPEALDQFKPGDADRISELYALLYLDRYSRLNPDFTPAYVELTRRIGMIRYEGLREADGRLSVAVGYCRRGGVLTTPVVGYDTTRPQADGLYRIASALFTLAAEREGLKLNGSAGAPAFKRHRGGRPVIEYSAYYAAHLPRPASLVLKALQRVLEMLVRPMEKEGAF